MLLFYLRFLRHLKAWLLQLISDRDNFSLFILKVSDLRIDEIKHFWIEMNNLRPGAKPSSIHLVVREKKEMPYHVWDSKAKKSNLKNTLYLYQIEIKVNPNWNKQWYRCTECKYFRCKVFLHFYQKYLGNNQAWIAQLVAAQLCIPVQIPSRGRIFFKKSEFECWLKRHLLWYTIWMYSLMTRVINHSTFKILDGLGLGIGMSWAWARIHLSSPLS